MEPLFFVFLAGGLFLGWALGANDSANVFGTAVGTRMLRFKTAAILCSVGILLGAVISGAGPAETLGKLAAIDSLREASIASASAGLTVFLMTRKGLPVSTSQAIVGALIGWNLSNNIQTDLTVTTKILSTWILCPILAGAIAAALLPLTGLAIKTARLRLLQQDAFTRWALVIAGFLGAYSLGANNIANVMGPFAHSIDLDTVSLGGLISLSPLQQLFLIGSVAVAIGVFTYSRQVMMTVGKDLFELSPVAGWVVVMAHSIVLFIFTSKALSQWIAGVGLPAIPLVPVSSSQAVIGAVIGIGLIRGRHGIRWRVLGGIGLGWLMTPVASGVVCFAALALMKPL
ncbi:MAG: anion permease [Gammaproteobacteria bacterium]|nr:anion permease [Gammaproteobacteria bacterium]NDA13935.1 anion permease [Gammaproteobacteria bacterium]NDG43429.1 anion permease [Gammaproteobacteria bacterium]